MSAAPPMGWVCRAGDDKFVRDAANAIATSGMRAAGYITIYAPGAAGLKPYLESKGLRLMTGGIDAPRIDGLPLEAQRSTFTMSAMQAAPLIVDGDPRAMSAATRSIVLNRELIAIDQDSLRQPGSLLAKQGDIEIWTRALSSGRTAVALFNRGGEPADVRVRWPDLGLKRNRRVRDVWARRNLGSLTDAFVGNLKPQGVILLLID